MTHIKLKMTQCIKWKNLIQILNVSHLLLFKA